MGDDIDRLDRIIRETLPELEADGLDYGPFRPRYASGREGDASRVSVAERKTGISGWGGSGLECHGGSSDDFVPSEGIN